MTAKEPTLSIAQDSCAHYMTPYGDGDWLPNYGTTRVGAALDLTADIENWFTWSTARINNVRFHACIDPFRPNGIYEHDVTVNIASVRRYLGSIRSWSSTLPNDYLDTAANLPIVDDPNEISYAVGSTDSFKIVAGTEYYTHIRTNRHAQADPNTAAVISQEGRRVPPWCHTAGCAFPRTSQCPIEAWNLPVPGTVSWNNWYEPTTEFDCASAT